MARKNSQLLIFITCMLVCVGLGVFIILKFVIPLKNGTLAELPAGTVYSEKDIDKSIIGFLNTGVKRYAGDKISASEKEAYQRLLMGILAHAERIDIKDCGLTLDQLRKVYSCLRNDYPEIFWISNNCDVYTNTVTQKMTDCLPNYLYDNKTVVMMIGNIEKIRDTIKARVKDYDPYHKIMYVFDYIIDNTVYDSLSYDNYMEGSSDANLEFACNIYGTLFKGRALCEGYSKTFQYLMNSMGIDCLYLTGVSKEQGHAWNCVYLDNSWYGMDVTWCDPQGTTDRKSYAYCMVDQETLDAGHTLDMPYEVPNCGGGRYNYYEYNNLELTVFSTEILSDIFLRAYDAGDSFVEFHCATRQVYNDFLASVQSQEIFKCFAGIREKHGERMDYLNYGLMEDALSVRVEIK